MNNRQDSRTRVEWSTVHSIKRLIVRPNKYEETIKVIINRSTHHVPQYSIKLVTEKTEKDTGKIFDAGNVSVGFDGLIREDPAFDNTWNCIYELMDEARAWIMEELRTFAPQYAERIAEREVADMNRNKPVTRHTGKTERERQKHRRPTQEQS